MASSKESLFSTMVRNVLVKSSSLGAQDEKPIPLEKAEGTVKEAMTWKVCCERGERVMWCVVARKRRGSRHRVRPLSRIMFQAARTHEHNGGL